MEVVVLLAGVVDPKCRIERLALRPDTALVDETGLPRKLSPFDEAALETALQLRDADPAVRVTVALIGDASADALLRAIAAHRPDRAFRFGGPALSLWDPISAVRHLRDAIDVAAKHVDLVLMGREFGDSDDGVLPPSLAEASSQSFCGLAHTLRIKEGRVIAQRMRGTHEETLALDTPALVSVTNHRGNRLRHPLMKNIALARRAPLEIASAQDLPSTGALELQAIALAAPSARGMGRGRILTGASEEHIRNLATVLREGLRSTAA